ncbi:MAG: hypothetical protein QNK05_13325 [Myxococcota bacterium]|nr:hypothetical protein [Myxococcota bacterium]
MNRIIRFSILFSACLGIALGTLAAGAAEPSDSKRARLVNKPVKWQSVRTDASHALVGAAAEAERRAFRVAPRAKARAGARR